MATLSDQINKKKMLPQASAANSNGEDSSAPDDTQDTASDSDNEDDDQSSMAAPGVSSTPTGNAMSPPSSLASAIGAPPTVGVGPVANPDEYKGMLSGSAAATPPNAPPAVAAAQDMSKNVSSNVQKGGGSYIPSDKEAKQYLQQAQNVIDQFASTADKTQKGYQTLADTLKQAQADAKQAYDEKANRNDWLEVAQTLGRAVAQFAGSRAGLQSRAAYGSNMSELNMGNPIDYQARNQRAFDEMKQANLQAGETTKLGAEGLGSTAANEKQALSDRLNVNLSGAREATNRADIAARMAEADKRNELMDKYYSGRIENGQARNDLSQQRLDAQGNPVGPVGPSGADARFQARQQNTQVQAANQLNNLIETYAAAGSKEQAKLAPQLDKLAAQAGLPPELNQPLNNLKHPQSSASWLGSKIGLADKQPTTAETIDTIHKGIENYLNTINAKAGKPAYSPPAAPMQNNPGQAASTPDTIRIKINGTNQTGTIHLKDFDPNTMTKI